MGTAQLFSVPYAMVSEYAFGGVDNPFTMYGDTIQMLKSVDVIGNYPKEEEEALFEVKRQDGQTMFAVYNQGVRINVPMDDLIKGVKGGFAIGGFGSSKGSATNFMDITPKNYFIGHETGTKTDETALYNSVLGYKAARNLTTGKYNTILGYKADNSLTSGSNNIIIGASAGLKLTSGSHNTLIGYGAGLNHTNQTYNVMIGTTAGYNKC